MRQKRNFRTDTCYHLISRIAHRAFFLNEEERTRFVERLWRVAHFSCVDVLAYCVMSNHFHLLIYIPEPGELKDGEIRERICTLYSGSRQKDALKEWDDVVKAGSAERMRRLRKKYLRRMWNASEFMKTLKQDSTMSFNGRRAHVGTMWESRFRARMIRPEEKTELMQAAGYIDRNPVKAKIVGWPDKYAWCSFAAADAGDERCRQGYRYIYTFAPLNWEQVKAFHEAFIGLAIKELEEERVSGAKVFKGVSMDERKREKIAHHHLSELEVSLPDVLPKLLDKGNDRVTFDILTLLKKGDMRPAELREALGISSANYFTARYLTPMVKKGLIEHVTSHARFSPCSSYRLTAKGKGVLHF